mmetsp:Transcript_28193/g.71888  ORF Transcript_28193/g.71888 Transcript_28193/m.71888 type:complete len:258 (-) Transcript_28193:586-1359(-)
MSSAPCPSSAIRWSTVLMSRCRQGRLVASNICCTLVSTEWLGSSLLDQPSSTSVVTTTAQMWPGSDTLYWRTSSRMWPSVSAPFLNAVSDQSAPSSSRLSSLNVASMADLNASGSGHCCPGPENRSVHSPHARPSMAANDWNSPIMLRWSSPLSSVAMPTSSSTICGCSHRRCSTSMRARVDAGMAGLASLSSSSTEYSAPTSPPEGGASRTRMLPGCRSEWMRLSMSIICSMVPAPMSDSFSRSPCGPPPARSPLM